MSISLKNVKKGKSLKEQEQSDLFRKIKHAEQWHENDKRDIRPLEHLHKDQLKNHAVEFSVAHAEGRMSHSAYYASMLAINRELRIRGEPVYAIEPNDETNIIGG